MLQSWSVFRLCDPRVQRQHTIAPTGRRNHADEASIGGDHECVFSFGSRDVERIIKAQASLNGDLHGRNKEVRECDEQQDVRERNASKSKLSLADLALAKSTRPNGVVGNMLVEAPSMRKPSL